MTFHSLTNLLNLIFQIKFIKSIKKNKLFNKFDMDNFKYSLIHQMGQKDLFKEIYRMFHH